MEREASTSDDLKHLEEEGSKQQDGEKSRMEKDDAKQEGKESTRMEKDSKQQEGEESRMEEEDGLEQEGEESTRMEKDSKQQEGEKSRMEEDDSTQPEGEESTRMEEDDSTQPEGEESRMEEDDSKQEGEESTRMEEDDSTQPEGEDSTRVDRDSDLYYRSYKNLRRPRLYVASPVCRISVLKKNMSRHYKRVHKDSPPVHDSLPSCMVDPKQGIYLVQRSSSGRGHINPVHVQFRTSSTSQSIVCTDDKWRDTASAAR